MIPIKPIFKGRVVIKRWSEAESFTIFENHVYTSKKNPIFETGLLIKVISHFNRLSGTLSFEP